MKKEVTNKEILQDISEFRFVFAFTVIILLVMMWYSFEIRSDQYRTILENQVLIMEALEITK